MTRINDATDRRVTDFGDVLPNAAGQTYDPSLRAFLAERGLLVDRDAVSDVPLDLPIDLDDELGEDPGLTNLMVSVAVVAVVFAGVFIFGRVIEMFATAGVA